MSQDIVAMNALKQKKKGRRRRRRRTREGRRTLTRRRRRLLRRTTGHSFGGGGGGFSGGGSHDDDPVSSPRVSFPLDLPFRRHVGVSHILWKPFPDFHFGVSVAIRLVSKRRLFKRSRLPIKI